MYFSLGLVYFSLGLLYFSLGLLYFSLGLVYATGAACCLIPFSDQNQALTFSDLLTKFTLFINQFNLIYQPI